MTPIRFNRWFIALMAVIAIPVFVAVPLLYFTESYASEVAFTEFRVWLTLTQIGLCLLLGLCFFMSRRFSAVAVWFFPKREEVREKNNYVPRQEKMPFWMRLVLSLGTFSRKYRRWPWIEKSLLLSAAFIAPAIFGSILLLVTDIQTGRLITAVILTQVTVMAGLLVMSVMTARRHRKILG